MSTICTKSHSTQNIRARCCDYYYHYLIVHVPVMELCVHCASLGSRRRLRCCSAPMIIIIIMWLLLLYDVNEIEENIRSDVKLKCVRCALYLCFCFSAFFFSVRCTASVEILLCTITCVCGAHTCAPLQPFQCRHLFYVPHILNASRIPHSTEQVVSVVVLVHAYWFVVYRL